MSGGALASGKKAYARRVRYEEISNVGRLPKQARTQRVPAVTFDDVDCEGLIYPHDDALVVTMLVANYTTRRILVDNGNLAIILFLEAFSKLGIDQDRLRPSPTTLIGLFSEIVQLVGSITLSVTEGVGRFTATTMADFLVVKAHSSYNAIIEWPTLNNLKLVTSTYHLKMKFLTKDGVGVM